LDNFILWYDIAMKINIKHYDKRLKSKVIGRCWEYIDDNFHKLSETNKIKVSLELIKRDIPQKIEGEVTVTQMPTIKAGDSRLGLLPLELKIGDDIRTPTDASDAGEALSDIN